LEPEQAPAAIDILGAKIVGGDGGARSVRSDQQDDGGRELEENRPEREKCHEFHVGNAAGPFRGFSR